MDNKTKCEIVKDLAIPYKENLINEGSKRFVEEHLLTCDNCKKYYEDINSDILDNNKTEKNNDDIVINGLKKVHRRLNILKMSLTLILVIIVTLLSIFVYKFIKVKKVVDSAYSKIEYMKGLDNYKLTVKTINKNFGTNESNEYTQDYYYKDGKYKIEADDSIKFYQDESLEKVCVYHNLNQIEYYKHDFIEEHKGNLINIFSDIINYKKDNPFFLLGLSVRNDRYNGADCFVIRTGNNNSHRDVWIDKETLTTIRVVNEEYMNFYSEIIYSFTENIVTDQDVDISILDSEKYKDYVRKDITQNATEDLRSYYDLYNKR